MQEYAAKDMLIHEYDEFEWGEFRSKVCEEEYLAASVAETKEKGLRYFNVLVKPIDDLLSDEKPNNPYIIDTWRWDCKIRAKEIVQKYGDVAIHNTAILALLARSYGARISHDTDATHSTMYIPIRGIGFMQCLVPNLVIDDLFSGIPEETKNHKSDIWDSAKIVEAILMMDKRQHG
jgi:hypothetical protein